MLTNSDVRLLKPRVIVTTVVIDHVQSIYLLFLYL